VRIDTVRDEPSGGNRMKTLKRLLAVLGMLLSVLVLLVSIGGLVGGWTVGGALKDGTTKVLTGAERALEVTDDGLNRVDMRLDGARGNINTIEEAVTLVGENVEETDFALLLIEKTVGEELFPKIESVRETVDTVRASVVAFNSTLEAANEIPFVSVPTLTDELQAGADRVSEARTAADELRTNIDVAKSGAVQGAVNAITERTSRIDGALEELQGVVADYHERISTVEDDVASLKSRIRLWIDVVTIIISAGFLWVAISQIAMLGLGWSYLRRGELVLRKKREPADIEAPEVSLIPEPEIDQLEMPQESTEEDADADE
jgi:archaellum component FlaC